MGMGDLRHAPAALYPQETDPVPIVQEAGCVQGPVWTGVENLAPTGIRSPDRPARSGSLYRLSYPGPRQQDLRDILASSFWFDPILSWYKLTSNSS
jgi:hypothetical protein